MPHISSQVIRDLPEQQEFNPTLTSTQTMALNIGHLLDGGSSESEFESDPDTLSPHDQEVTKKVNTLFKEFEQTALESIRVNHHLKMAKEEGKPPKGLMPTIKLTAYLGTSELLKSVNQALMSCSVNACKILQTHYSSLLKDNKEKMTKIESDIKDQVYSMENEEHKQRLIQKTHENSESVVLVRSKLVS